MRCPNCNTRMIHTVDNDGCDYYACPHCGYTERRNVMRSQRGSAAQGLMSLIGVGGLLLIIVLVVGSVTSGVVGVVANNNLNQVVDAVDTAAKVVSGEVVYDDITPYSLPEIGEISKRCHADEAHEGANAVRALLSQSAKCLDCEDGRRRCWAPGQKSDWGFGVYEFAEAAHVWVEVTVFNCKQDYIITIHDMCDPGWRDRLHP